MADITIKMQPDGTWLRRVTPEEHWLEQQRKLAFATDVMDGPEDPPKPDRTPMEVNKEADE